MYLPDAADPAQEWIRTQQRPAADDLLATIVNAFGDRPSAEWNLIDIGHGCGAVSAAIASLGARVYAFERDEHLMDVLTATIDENAFPNVTQFLCALGDHVGMLAGDLPLRPLNNFELKAPGAVTVIVIAAADAAAILRGAGAVIARLQPAAILIRARGNRPAELLDVSTDLGYGHLSAPLPELYAITAGARCCEVAEGAPEPAAAAVPPTAAPAGEAAPEALPADGELTPLDEARKIDPAVTSISEIVHGSTDDPSDPEISNLLYQEADLDVPEAELVMPAGDALVADNPKAPDLFPLLCQFREQMLFDPLLQLNVIPGYGTLCVTLSGITPEIHFFIEPAPVGVYIGIECTAAVLTPVTQRMFLNVCKLYGAHAPNQALSRIQIESTVQNAVANLRNLIVATFPDLLVVQSHIA